MSYEIGVEKLVVTTSQQQLTENQIAAMTLTELEQLKSLVEKYITLYQAGESIEPLEIDPQRFIDSASGTLPLTIAIPLKVSKAANYGTRQLTITSPDMPIHTEIKRWIMSDPRYSRWFTAETLERHQIQVEYITPLPD